MCRPPACVCSHWAPVSHSPHSLFTGPNTLGALSSLGSLGSLTSGPRDRGNATQNDPRSLEHVRQGLLTMYTMLSTNPVPSADDFVAPRPSSTSLAEAGGGLRSGAQPSPSAEEKEEREERQETKPEAQQPGSGAAAEHMPVEDLEEDDAAFQECNQGGESKTSAEDLAAKSTQAARCSTFFVGQWLDAKDTVLTCPARTTAMKERVRERDRESQRATHGVRN